MVGVSGIWVSAGDLVRHVKLLRIDSKVRSFVPQQALAGGIGAVGDLRPEIPRAGGRPCRAISPSRFTKALLVKNSQN